MESTLNKPLVGNLVYSLLGRSSSGSWRNKPADWSDIRKDCPKNSIALYAGVKSDYSQYDNLGFNATCVGGYNVFIDGTQYGTTYASGTQCNITWSTSGITTGDDITKPSALKAHKIWISPATEGNNITAFHCARVADSGKELQGVLWAHFNLSNRIVAGYQTFSGGAFYNTTYHNNMIKAVTAKNNLLKITYFNQFVGENLSLEYVPTFESNLSNDLWIAGTAGGCKKITVKNYVCDNNRFDYSFCSCSKLENVILKNCTISPSNLTAAFNDCFKLKKVPETIDYSNATNMAGYLYRTNSLEDTVLDVSAATGLTKIGCFGTSQYFMSGFKGLRVSNEAPFSNATAPQINVSYTGMDRTALVTLFNDLPTVSAGQIINITGAVGANNLTGSDMDIAINKGWTITGSRDYVIDNGVLTWANPNIYLQGDGNSCILTDYAPSYKTSMDIKVGDVNNWIWGARNSVGTIDFGIAYYLATFGKNILQFSNMQSGTYTFNYSQTLIRNGVTIGTFPETSLVGTTKMLLYGIRNELNENSSLSNGKIYYCKIYDDNELLYHFVPVPQGLEIGNFTVPSNGMFDIVNQQFYANAGTGTFTYGKDN